MTHSLQSMGEALDRVLPELFKKPAKGLVARIAADERFASVDPKLLVDTISDLYEGGQASKLAGKKGTDFLHGMLTQAHALFPSTAGTEIEALQHRLLKPKPTVTAVKRQTSHFLGVDFSKLSGEQKLWGGISLGLAGLNIVSAASAFSNSVDSDGQGKTRVHLSNIGWGLVNVALAGAMIYAGGHNLGMFQKAPVSGR